MNETTTAAPALDPAIPVGVPFEQLPLRPLIRRYGKIMGTISRYWRHRLTGYKTVGEMPMEMMAETAYWYATNIIKGRWLAAEAVIAAFPFWAVRYAKEILKGRWGAAEPAIAKYPFWAHVYARDVLEKRWLEAEPFIATDPDAAYWYAVDTLKGRFKAAEPVLATSAYLAFWYALDILKDRFEAAEPAILASRWADDYRAAFGLADAA